MTPTPRPWEAARDGAEGTGKGNHPPAGPRPPEVQRQTRPGRGRSLCRPWSRRRRDTAITTATPTPHDRRTSQ